MQPKKYGAVLLKEATFRDIPMLGDALSIAGARTITALYSELTGHQSFITRLPIEEPGSAIEALTEGQEPALSANGKWLAFVREEHGQSSGWLLATDSKNVSLMVLPGTYHVLDLSVTSEGDVIAAAGRTSDPHLFLVRHRTGEVVELTEFPHPARYPSVSPDGERLAFSRRDHGFWHLLIREFATGREQQLTHASCNAVSPSWENSSTLLYATDCGRGVGLSAIARLAVPR
jgi:dipeptidyl aminopeptidase/acylaminoacyl peptidase